MNPRHVVVTGAFDDLRSRGIRFLQEASRLGELTVLLWTDESIAKLRGRAPKFPEAERLYLLRAIRYVRRVTLIDPPADLNTLPKIDGIQTHVWAVESAEANPERRNFCAANRIELREFRDEGLQGFPEPPSPSSTARKKVIVTGCYDWFHSGHVRFFEEVSAFGDLFVVVGHDANVRLLKGEGRPLFPQAERRYVVGSIRFVRQALVSTGNGWLDAEPEIERLRPAIYAVNEDGDVPEKREYCAKKGIEYLVLRRVPATGLPKRSSTDLRGF